MLIRYGSTRDGIITTNCNWGNSNLSNVPSHICAVLEFCTVTSRIEELKLEFEKSGGIERISQLIGGKYQLDETE